MALSAAFSIAMIITGVASTGGSVASLNRLARCSGVTSIVKEPRVPVGGVRMMSPVSSAMQRKSIAVDLLLDRRGDHRAVAHRDADGGDHSSARDGQPTAPPRIDTRRAELVARVEEREADCHQRPGQ